MKLLRVALAALGILLPVSTGNAQYQARAWLKWRTIEAGRFAVHFPADLEPWARTVAGKLPGIDTAVSRLVGFAPAQRIDIVIDDPFHIPNGSAWPLLDQPRIVMWATPPSPRDDIGTFVSWADMLATHEFAHLAHLLRPTRNAFTSWLWRLPPVELGPISRKAPRWVIEGYATYVEGRITGSGRPNGVWRATILRQWALEGVLPTYGQLDQTGGMYGGSFAYLAGSSFLEWLAERRGDSSVVAVWRRMTARRDRGFAEAFAGVYGEPPDILYGRFAAEIAGSAAAQAVAIRRAGTDTGSVIQHLARETGDPAISRDGGRAAIMLASATRPGRVVIWRTIPEPDSSAERAARTLVARDPQDVPPYRPFPAPKRALATLYAVGNQSYQDPRFFTDGRVLVWRNTAVGDGSWMPDLYAWDPQRGSVTRITKRANVRQGDPSPDGTSIAATRCGGGTCDLVLVDAKSGAVSVVQSGSDTRSFHRPRYSPDGRHIAVSVHESGFWRVGLYRVADRSPAMVTTEARDWFDVAFLDDSTLVATANEGGVLNLRRLRTDGTLIGRLTNVSGAAVAPEPNPADGSVWFLALHARGWDVRATTPDARIMTVGTPPTPTPRTLPTSPVGDAKGYSPKHSLFYFPLGSVVRDGAAAGLALVVGDPAGRRELMVQAVKSASPRSVNAPLQGVVGTLTIRSSMPWVISGFGVRQHGPFWHSLEGGSIAIERSRRYERSSWRLGAGGTFSRVNSPLEDPQGANRWLVFNEGGIAMTRFRDGRRSTLSFSVHAAQGERGDAHIGRLIATAGLTSSEIVPFAFTAQYGTSQSASAAERFQLGGNPPTLLPPGILSQYVTQPALPPFFVGEQLEAYRVSIPFAGARLYGWAGRVFDDDGTPYERVLGAEWSASIPAFSPLGTPAARATVGLGRWMDRRDLTRQAPLDPAVFVAPRGAFQVYLTTQIGDWAR